jgi:hypothetical protein
VVLRTEAADTIADRFGLASSYGNSNEDKRQQHVNGNGPDTRAAGSPAKWVTATATTMALQRRKTVPPGNCNHHKETARPEGWAPNAGPWHPDRRRSMAAHTAAMAPGADLPPGRQLCLSAMSLCKGWLDGKSVFRSHANILYPLRIYSQKCFTYLSRVLTSLDIRD